MRHIPPSRQPLAACAMALTTLLCAACAMPPSKEEQEAAKNTFACMLVDERVVIRFDTGEARLLMPDGNRVSLYQIPADSGVRFSNGVMELRGKGMDLQLVNHGVPTHLKNCEQFVVPTK